MECETMDWTEEPRNAEARWSHGFRFAAEIRNYLFSSPIVFHPIIRQSAEDESIVGIC